MSFQLRSTNNNFTIITNTQPLTSNIRAPSSTFPDSYYLKTLTYKVASRNKSLGRESNEWQRTIGAISHELPVPNPLTPKISLIILLTVCHTIHIMLVWRIWNWINPQSPDWYFPLFSSLVWLIFYWYCKEKLCLGHSWELKGNYNWPDCFSLK